MSVIYPITLPNGKIVTIKPPSIKDRNEALREAKSKDVFYLAEDILLSYCIVSIDGVSVDPDKGDSFDIYSDLPVKDGQYLSQIFQDLFYLDEKAKKQAGEVTKNLLSQGTEKSTPATKK